MADDLTLKIPQMSRSGRVLKKSMKLKESEESPIDETVVKGKPREKPQAANEQLISSAGISQALLNTQRRRKKTTSSVRELPLKQSYEGPSSRLTIANKKSTFSSGKNSHEKGKKLVPPIKITKICPETVGDDLAYSVAEWSAKKVSSLKSMRASPTKSQSSESTEESSSGSSDTTSVSFSESSSDDMSNSHNRSDKQQHQQHNASSDESSSLESPPEKKTNNSTVLQKKLSDNESDEVDSNAAMSTDDDLATYSAPVQKTGTRKGPKRTISRLKPRKNTPRNATRVKKRAAVPKKPTSFMLWNNKNRKKIFALHKHLSLGEISKKVGEIWKALPEKEKALWKSKANKLALKGTTNNYINSGRSTAVAARTNEASDSAAGNSNDGYPTISQTEKALLGTAPIDVAARLTLLGDSLTGIGMKFLQLDHEPSAAGVYSALLDSLLCAVGPFLCLTRQIAGLEHLPEDTFLKTLDHIAYFIPGV